MSHVTMPDSALLSYRTVHVLVLVPLYTLFYVPSTLVP